MSVLVNGIHKRHGPNGLYCTHDKPTPKRVERLARALAAEMPGFFTFPPTGCPNEGIPGGLNALYDAGKLVANMDRA